MQDLKHKILLVLTAITIIGEVGSIILWIVNPTIPLGQARITLAVDYTIAVATAAVFCSSKPCCVRLDSSKEQNGVHLSSCHFNYQ